MMLDHPEAEEFVIATGKTYMMSDMVKMMFEIANIKDYDQYLETNSSLMRPSEVPFLLGNPTKANAILGWESKRSIYNLLEDLYKNDIDLLRGA